MMQIEEIQQTFVDLFKQYDIDRVWLIGSQARNEATDESDIDFMYERKNKYDLFKSDLSTLNLYEDIQNNVLNKSVDLVNYQDFIKHQLSESLINNIKKDMILIYKKENNLFNKTEFTKEEFKHYDKAIEKEWQNAKTFASVSIDNLDQIDNQSFEIK